MAIDAEERLSMVAHYRIDNADPKKLASAEQSYVQAENRRRAAEMDRLSLKVKEDRRGY
jgi:hypothetical protein